MSLGKKRSSMKVLQLSHADIDGGAARATYRIHRALIEQGLDSKLLVNRATSGDPTVVGPRSPWAKFMGVARAPIGALIARSFASKHHGLLSPGLLPSHWHKNLNSSSADIVNLHWINGEMLSIRDISKIRKPLVWTLHDMWAFCGAEHYSNEPRWREGYTSKNRQESEGRIDFNKWVWNRKKRIWSEPRHIVTPSRWLAECVMQSALLKNWQVTVIPNCIDTKVWRPVDKETARSVFNLPQDKKLILFGAMGGGADPRKGYDILLAALAELKQTLPNIELVVFGQHPPLKLLESGYKTHFVGKLHDEVSLALLYSSSDAFVVPSRQDNLPNTAIEAHACGIPVAAFDVGGLPDIVDHKKTGFLAQPFSPQGLAVGLKWITEDSDRNKWLKNNAREKALGNWTYKEVSKKYTDLYRSILEMNRN